MKISFIEGCLFLFSGVRCTDLPRRLPREMLATLCGHARAPHATPLPAAQGWPPGRQPVYGP